MGVGGEGEKTARFLNNRPIGVGVPRHKSGNKVENSSIKSPQT